MKPKLINLTDREIRELKKEAVNLGIPFAELVRRVIDAHIASRPQEVLDVEPDTTVDPPIFDTVTEGYRSDDGPIPDNL